jgi:uncharacterized protein YkwD
MDDARRFRAWIFIYPVIFLCSSCRSADLAPSGHIATDTAVSPVVALESSPFPTEVDSTAAPTASSSAYEIEVEKASPQVDERERAMSAAVAIVQGINLERGRMGRSTLQVRTDLFDIAFLRAEELVARGYFDHVDPADGRLPAQVELVRAGYSGKMGEVFVALFSPIGTLAPRALQAWWESEPHRQVLMDPAYRYLGVGLASDQVWWKVVILLAESAP